MCDVIRDGWIWLTIATAEPYEKYQIYTSLTAMPRFIGNFAEAHTTTSLSFIADKWARNKYGTHAETYYLSLTLLCVLPYLSTSLLIFHYSFQTHLIAETIVNSFRQDKTDAVVKWLGLILLFHTFTFALFIYFVFRISISKKLDKQTYTNYLIPISYWNDTFLQVLFPRIKLTIFLMEKSKQGCQSSFESLLVKKRHFQAQFTKVLSQTDEYPRSTL